MIRFLDLKDQICEDQNHFAFYDTTTDEIMTFDGVQVFSSFEEFKSSYSNSIYLNSNKPIERFLNLIPKYLF